METISLIPHPDFLPARLRGVTVEYRFADDHLFLAYGIDGAEHVRLPTDGSPGRQDGLWQSSCFELFAAGREGLGYREFNFAPLSRWAAYRFDGYRDGMADLALSADPQLVDSRLDDRGGGFPARYEFDVILRRYDLPAGPICLGLSAVIEELDGAKSYWAVRHPSGKPDFHHRDCFALELPAPTAA